MAHKQTTGRTAATTESAAGETSARQPYPEILGEGVECPTRGGGIGLERLLPARGGTKVERIHGMQVGRQGGEGGPEGPDAAGCLRRPSAAYEDVLKTANVGEHGSRYCACLGPARLGGPLTGRGEEGRHVVVETRRRCRERFRGHRKRRFGRRGHGFGRRGRSARADESHQAAYANETQKLRKLRSTAAADCFSGHPFPPVVVPPIGKLPGEFAEEKLNDHVHEEEGVTMVLSRQIPRVG
jgi:hypothetical protein